MLPFTKSHAQKSTIILMKIKKIRLGKSGMLIIKLLSGALRKHGIKLLSGALRKNGPHSKIIVEVIGGISMGKKLFFIYNPYSGKAQIKNKLMDIINVFVKNDYEVTLHPTQSGRDALERTKNLPTGVYDLLVCSGGDGTLDQIVSGMMQRSEHIPIGYIPAGTTNDFAISLNVPKNMVKAAEVAVNGCHFYSDIGSFNNTHFVYIAAFGIFTDVSYETKQEAKNILGHLAYVLEGVKRLYAIKSYFMKIEVEGETIEGDFMFGMISNSVSVGGFKNMTGKNVLLDDGLFEVTLIRKPKNPIELQEIIASLLIEEVNTEYVYTFKISEITINSSEAVPWTLDGEYGGKHQGVWIKNNKQALEIRISPNKLTWN